VLFRKSNKKAAKKEAADAASAPGAAPTPDAKTAAKKGKKEKPAKKPKPAIAPALHRKPQADVYTMLLVIALLAELTAILFCCLEMDLYNFLLKAGPPVGMVTSMFSGAASLFTFLP